MRRPFDKGCRRTAAATALAFLVPYGSPATGAPAGTESAAATVAAAASPLDIDGNGFVDPLTDGLLISRYLMGFRGDPLTAGALGQGAARTTPDAVQNFVASLLSGSGPLTTCGVVQYPNTAAQPGVQGNLIDLAVRCGAGFPPTSCAWTGGIASTACAVRIPAPAATSTISVVPSNPFGTVPAINTTVYVQGGTAGANYCTAADDVITLIWPATGQVRLQTSGFGSQITAFRLVVPMTFSPALDITHTGFVHVAEVPNTPPTPREFTVSKNACDFQSGNYIYNGTGAAIAAPTMDFTTNNPDHYLSVGGDFNINSGDVVYFNFRNSNNGVPACGTSACDMLFDFATPNRY